MSNTIAVSRGDLAYCQECADVFGTLEGRSKRCSCEASAQLVPWTGGDFPTPFELCWYCQAQIVRSGSRWSSYCCNRCGPKIRALNDSLDGHGLASLPVGRHSLMHARWASARTFTVTPIVAAWRDRRLRQAWTLYAQADTDWAAFARYIRDDLPAPDVERLSRVVQQAAPDRLTELLTSANRRLGKGRRG